MNDGNRRLLSRIHRPLLRLFGCTLAAACASLSAAPAQAGPYLLVEAETGRVIAQSDAGRPWYPASLTKLMTAYLTFEAMRERKLEPNTLLTVSANAVAQPPSKMGFKAGTQVTVDNAIKMLMVRSANDIAVLLAEGIAGSVDAFVERMNATAAGLGMTGSRFVNPHGLPNEGQVTTARDMAVLARAIVREFPEYELYFRIPAIQLGKRVIRNHNRLIDRYAGADGMKTGFICSSGFNVVASAMRDDRRLIAVVFGAGSAVQRAEDAARLLERGFGRDVSLARISDYEVGMLEAISNLGGAPVDLREELCGPKRRRPAAESDIDEDEAEAEADVAPPAAAKGQAKSGKGEPKAAAKARPSLLANLPASMPPVRVFVGPPPKTPAAAIVMQPAKSPMQSKSEQPTETRASAKPSAGRAAPTVQAAAVATPASTKAPVSVPIPQPRPNTR